MKHSKKYICRLETCSALSLSPREQGAYYRGAGDFSTEQLPVNSKVVDNGRVNIIYPFYQYSYGGRYIPQHTRHYIPGSSLKGAIGSDLLRVDNFPIDEKSLHLRTLMKVQDLPEEVPAGQVKTALKEFFPNVAVEMLDAGAECAGEIFSDIDPRAVLLGAEKKVQNRLKQLSIQLEKLFAYTPSCIGDLEALHRNLESLHNRHPGDEDNYLLLLGGYKGMLLSADFTTVELQSAIFVDTETMLPHGLVLLKLTDG